MFKPKELWQRLTTKLWENPKLIIPICVLLALVLFIAVEGIRAENFTISAHDYKKSAEVQELKSLVDKLQREAEMDEHAYFCEISADSLFKKYNSAYKKDSLEVESLFKEINNIAKNLSPPNFDSLLNSLFFIGKAEKESVDINNSINKIKNLSEENLKNKYCLELEDAITSLYFLNSIRTIEGVNALLPGQIDNFIINSRQAFEDVSVMKPPKEFDTEHKNISKLIKEITNDLKKENNDIETFVDENYDNFNKLEQQIKSINAKSEELQNLPVEMGLSATVLEPN